MIVQAIVTRYLSPTNYRGARVKASAAAGSIIVPWDHGGNIEANHALACAALVRKLGWEDGRWHQGHLPDDRGYCFVRSEK